MYNKPYESTLKPYSPDSVKSGLKSSPKKGDSADEKLRPYSHPEIPKSEKYEE